MLVITLDFMYMYHIVDANAIIDWVLSIENAKELSRFMNGDDDEIST